MKYLKTFEKVIGSHDIDEILKSYFEAAIWAEEEYFRTERNIEYLSVHDFSKEAEKKSKEQIKWFLKNAEDILEDARDDVIGHDLWLTRRGYGVGFSDRGYYDDDEKIILEELSHQLGNVDMDVDVDEKGNNIIYLYSNDNYKKFDINKFKEKLEFDRINKKYNI